MMRVQQAQSQEQGVTSHTAGAAVCEYVCAWDSTGMQHTALTYVYRLMYCSALNCSSGSFSSSRISLLMPTFGECKDRGGSGEGAGKAKGGPGSPGLQGDVCLPLYHGLLAAAAPKLRELALRACRRIPGTQRGERAALQGRTMHARTCMCPHPCSRETGCLGSAISPAVQWAGSCPPAHSHASPREQIRASLPL